MTFLSFTIARKVTIVTFLPVMNDKKVTIGTFLPVMNDKKVTIGDVSVTFLPVMNDTVNDKKGHNFMNDKTYWFSLDLQSNTLPLGHQGCWHLVLITSVI